MSNEALIVFKRIETLAHELVRLREDLRGVQDEVFVDFLENSDEPVEVQYERKRKILEARRRIVTLVTEAREAEANAELQSAEAAKIQEHYANTWQQCSHAQKAHLLARKNVAEAAAEGAIARIKQCELELQFDLSYVKKLMGINDDTTISKR